MEPLMLFSLMHSHVQNPFLLSQDIEDLFDHAFNHETATSTSANIEKFRVFMILAIGSVGPHRNGTHQHHPYGYYLSAMQHFDQTFLAHGLASVQDLLLVCRFGIFQYTGERLRLILSPSNSHA
jgi:hypothetical protein